jgi:hypothetical protein
VKAGEYYNETCLEKRENDAFFGQLSFGIYLATARVAPTWHIILFPFCQLCELPGGCGPSRIIPKRFSSLKIPYTLSFGPIGPGNVLIGEYPLVLTIYHGAFLSQWL